MQVSVVIPTCNRRKRLLSLLGNLNASVYPIYEVIVVDSGEEPLCTQDLTLFQNLRIHCLTSPKSVCIQRNAGIRQTRSPWILLCDDDVELAPDYLQKLACHATTHPEAGAVSGIWMEPDGNGWTGMHPERSARSLLFKFVFKLGIWGEIRCGSKKMVARHIVQYYQKRGNHLSPAGWPVITDFAGAFFTTPVYSLGASLVKRSWLESSPYDEVLDRYGIGDNYGVALGFPSGIRVLNNARVYHHLEPVNRLHKPLQFYRRVLALDYFRRKKQTVGVRRLAILWSLAGQIAVFIYKRNGAMGRVAIKAFGKILLNNNPYWKAWKRGDKVVEVS